MKQQGDRHQGISCSLQEVRGQGLATEKSRGSDLKGLRSSKIGNIRTLAQETRDNLLLQEQSIILNLASMVRARLVAMRTCCYHLVGNFKFLLAKENFWSRSDDRVELNAKKSSKERQPNPMLWIFDLFHIHFFQQSIILFNQGHLELSSNTSSSYY